MLLRTSGRAACAALAALALAACTSELPLPPQVKLTCADSACPTGWTCNTKVDPPTCVLSGEVDTTSPTVVTGTVTPQAVNVTLGAVTATFTVSEKLGVEPEVTFVNDPPLAAFVHGTGDLEGTAWVFTYTPDGSEPRGRDLTVRALLRDRQGLTGEAVIGSVRFDYTPPELQAVAVTGSPATTGATVRIAFEVSEDPLADPVVKLGGTSLARDAAASHHLHYEYAYVSAGTESEDPAGLPVTVDLQDQAGNPLSREIGRAVFDRTPPAIEGVVNLDPAAASIGVLVTATFTTTEDLAADPAVTLGTIALDRGSRAGRSYVYGHVTGAADAEGTYPLSISLQDLAGNVATVPGPSATFDHTTPVISGLTVCDDDGTNLPCPAPQATFSAQPGHDAAKITFTLSEAAAVEVSVGTSPLAAPDGCSSADGRAYVCTHRVVDPAAGAQPRMETAALYVTVQDAAGNRTLDSTFLTRDFQPPRLAGTPLLERCDAYRPARLATDDLWTKPKASYGCDFMVSAGRGPVRLSFTVDEPLPLSPPSSGLLAVRLDDGTAFWPDPDNTSPTQFTAVLPTDPAEGVRQVVADVRDAVGNAAALVLGTLRVDLTPPASPATTSAGLVRYQRFPWGADATRGAKAFYLVGAAGAVAPGATVVAYDGSDLTRAATIGRTTANGDGSFGGPEGSTVAFSITSGNVAEVFVAQEDPAGNSSLPALVWDGEWVATPGFKVPGDTTANPSVLALDPAWRAAVRYPETQVEPPNAGQLGRSNQTLLATTGAPDFRDLTPDAGVPVARGQCAGAWDADHGRLVVHGGLSAVRAAGSFNTTWYGDTWTWDGARWSQLQTSGSPGARSGHVMVHDPVRQRTVLFGGQGDTGALGDTWELSGSRWTRACWPGCATGAECTCTQSPPSLGFAFWDPTAGRVVGVTSSGASQTWAWDGRDWSLLAPAHPLPVAASRVATSPELSTSLVLVGGSGTWTWSGGDWIGPAALPPFDTSGHPFVFTEVVTWWDPGVGRYVAWDPYPNQLFAWDGGAWSALPAPAATPFDSTFASCGGYDRADGAYVRFGGCFYGIDAVCHVPEGGVRNTTLRVTPASALTLAPGTMPAARRNSGMADVRDEGIAWLVQGIGTSVDPYSDDWSWNGHAWTARGNSPVNFVDVPVSWLGPGRIIQYGGTPTGPSGYYRNPAFTFYRTSPGNTWASWQATGQTWPYLEPDGVGSAQGDQALAWHPGFGAVYFHPNGAPSTWSATWTDFNLAWLGQGSVAGVLWTSQPSVASPASVRGHRMAYCPGAGGVVLFGGTNSGGALLDETWLWNGTWTQLSPPTRPPARANHVVFCDERRDKVYLIGGNGAAGPLADVWQFDGATWVELSPALRPDARKGAAGAFLSGLGRGVVVGGLGSGLFGDTWDFDGGRDRRPAHLFHASFAAAGTGAATLEAVEASWIADANSASPDPVPTFQADLYVRDGERWVASGSGNINPQRLITWSTTTDPAWTALPPAARALRLRNLLGGDRLDLSLAVAPHGTNATLSPGAALTTGYVEARVRYRLGCLAAGASTTTPQRCCSGIAFVDVCN